MAYWLCLHACTECDLIIRVRVTGCVRMEAAVAAPGLGCACLQKQAVPRPLGPSTHARAALSTLTGHDAHVP